MSQLGIIKAYEKATVNSKIVLIGRIAKHLFVFNPKESHYYAFDSRRPNQVLGLTINVDHLYNEDAPERRCFLDTVAGLLKCKTHIE